MIRIAIVGATSAIATEVARQYSVSTETEFVLIGRNSKLLDTLLQDLKVRGASSGSLALCTELDNPRSIQETVQKAIAGGTPEIVLVAQGSLPDQLECEQDSVKASQELYLNGISPVLWAEAFVAPMLEATGGVIAVIGSVAGDRGRKSNYVYGSAKSMIDAYLKGMQHRLAGSNVTPLLIKPGPVLTPMTAHLQGQIRGLASTSEVARDIRGAISKNKRVIYTPQKWLIIMAIIRAIPSFVFNKLNL